MVIFSDMDNPSFMGPAAVRKASYFATRWPA
jgi:hypothetical protein